MVRVRRSVSSRKSRKKFLSKLKVIQVHAVKDYELQKNKLCMLAMMLSHIEKTRKQHIEKYGFQE
jgi:ribosomal protein L20